MEQQPLPPEITNPILEIVYYALAAIGGWIAKWLQGRRKEGKRP